jgi:hypothetical protein
MVVNKPPEAREPGKYEGKPPLRAKEWGKIAAWKSL